MDEGKGTIGELRSTFNDFKTEISGMIADSSETIDNYRKLGVKVVFGVLALLNIAIAVFMFLLCFGNCCQNVVVDVYVNYLHIYYGIF